MWRVLVLVLGLLSLGLFTLAFWQVIDEKADHEARLERLRAERAETAPAAEAVSPASPSAGTTPAEAVPAPETGAGTAPLSLSLPLACTPGEDCWVINYVDRDPGPGRADFMCLDMSYDGHKGTDFALAHTGLLERNVPVLASAPGRVVGVRDDMDDVSFREIGREAVEGRECGNGVRLDHGDGWATQYCHMKRDSVLVSVGQTVARGQVLGAVGLSGLTEFPHVHVSVNRGSEVIDPFVGVDGAPDCGPGDRPLWQPELRDLLSYRAPKLLDLGLAARQVEKAEAETGALSGLDTLPATGEALVLWMRMAGVRPGDRAAVRISGPDGVVFEDVWQAEDADLVRFQFLGRRTPDGGWPVGAYEGRVTLSRAGTVTAERGVGAVLR